MRLLARASKGRRKERIQEALTLPAAQRCGAGHLADPWQATKVRQRIFSTRRELQSALVRHLQDLTGSNTILAVPSFNTLLA